MSNAAIRNRLGSERKRYDLGTVTVFHGLKLQLFIIDPSFLSSCSPNKGLHFKSVFITILKNSHYKHEWNKRCIGEGRSNCLNEDAITLHSECGGTNTFAHPISE